MAAGATLTNLDLGECSSVSKHTLTHVVSLCTRLESLNIAGCTLLREDGIRRLLRTLAPRRVESLHLECAMCGATDDAPHADVWAPGDTDQPTDLCV